MTVPFFVTRTASGPADAQPEPHTVTVRGRRLRVVDYDEARAVQVAVAEAERQKREERRAAEKREEVARWARELKRREQEERAARRRAKPQRMPMKERLLALLRSRAPRLSSTREILEAIGYQWGSVQRIALTTLLREMHRMGTVVRVVPPRKGNKGRAQYLWGAKEVQT